MGNQIRHKAICQPESSDSESDTEEEMKGRKRTRSHNRIEKRDSTLQVNKNKNNTRGVELKNNEEKCGPSGIEKAKRKGGYVSETSKSDS